MNTGEICAALAGFAVIIYCVMLYKDDFLYYRTGRIPRRPGLGLLDSFRFVWNMREFLREGHERYGLVFRTNLFFHPLVCVAGKEYARFVYNNPDLFETQPPGRLLEDFILVQNGHRHRKLRKMAVAAINEDAIRYNLTVVLDEFRDLREWKTVDWYPSMKQKLVRVFFRVVFGGSAESPRVAGLPPAHQGVFTECETMALLETFLSAVATVPLYVPGTAYYRGVQARRVLIELFKGRVRQRRKEILVDFLPSAAAAHTPEKRTGGAPGVMLDRIIERNLVAPFDDKLSDNEIATLCLFVILAAIDTTTSVLGSVLREVGPGGRLHAAIEEEHERVWASPCSKAIRESHTIDAIYTKLTEDLPETTKLLAEVMRVHAPFAGTLRVTKGAVRLANTSYIIPEGSFVCVSHDVSFKLHRRSPHSVLPDREDAGDIFPFGIGAHRCPGQHLALTEMKLIITLLLERGWPETYIADDTLVQAPALQTKYGAIVRFS